MLNIFILNINAIIFAKSEKIKAIQFIKMHAIQVESLYIALEIILVEKQFIFKKNQIIYRYVVK